MFRDKGRHVRVSSAAFSHRALIQDTQLSGRLKKRMIRVVESRQRAQILCMICNRVEIKRGIQLDSEALRVSDRLALGKSIGLIGPHPCTEAVGIHRIARVDMEIAEKGLF